MFACPTAATLARMGDDSLGGTTDGVLERHIEGCPECQARLERLARNDAGAEGTMPRLPEAGRPPEIPGFVIERELGRGAMSVVYQGRQPSLDRRVALKVVRSGPAAGSLEQTRWLREARSFSRVRHDHVVRLYQVGEADGWLYLVLELIPGGTLKDRLDIPYAAQDAARLIEIIAGAVAAVHRAGLLHLDLKPSNVLLDAAPDTPRERAAPRVGDFGIAYRWNDPDATTTVTGLAGPLGTPSYMAPEQVKGDRAAIGPAADIYGLGALLYHVLTGRPPYSAPSVAETLEQVRNQEPVPPRRLNPAIPPDLETVCLKCLQKKPGDRYASAEAVAEDLHRFVDGRPIVARPVSPLEKSWRWCRRRPVVAALAGTLALTLSAAFVSILLLWKHAEAERRRAEADYMISQAALFEILDLESRAAGSTTLSRDHLISCVQSARRRLLELAEPRSDDLANWYLIALLDQELGRNLGRIGKPSERHFFDRESLMYWEKVLGKDPRDLVAMYRRMEILHSVAAFAENQGKVDESIILWEQAIVAGEKLLTILFGSDCRPVLASTPLSRLVDRTGDHQRARNIVEGDLRMLDAAPLSLAECRNSLAELLVRRGDHQRARMIREAHLRMLESVPSRAMTPRIALDFVHRRVL